jgi:hypothetical protein
MEKFLRVAVIAAVGLVCGCEEIEQLNRAEEKPEEREIVYVIPSGEHSALQSSYEPMKVSSIRFNALFNNSAIYKTIDEKNQGDINKLYGVSDCNSAHQTNSARFGWRWFSNKLEIWAYAYINTERKYTFITAVALNTANAYELSFTSDSYVFKVNDTKVKLPRSCQNEANGYKLYPYFGGDETAPHQITIRIEDIK